MLTWIRSFVIVVLLILPVFIVYSEKLFYDSPHKKKIKSDFYNYPFVFDDSLEKSLIEYINLYPKDWEIQLKLVNLYELYGDYNKSIRVLKKMEQEFVNHSRTHEYFYYRNLGYQRYFYHKFHMNKELRDADKIYFNLNKPGIKNYFQKESWIPIDQKLKRGDCPSDSEFLLFNNKLDKYKIGKSEGVALMVFLRMHFDMLFGAGCNSKTNEIRDSFKTYHSIRQNKYSEALYLTMLADYKLLEEGKSCSISEAYDLYDKVDGYIGTEINAEWIRQEIEYRMERIRGSSELERSSRDCKR